MIVALILVVVSWLVLLLLLRLLLLALNVLLFLVLFADVGALGLSKAYLGACSASAGAAEFMVIST